MDLPAPLGRTGIGICMDLNPMTGGPFTVDTIPYEFADFAVANHCRTLVVPCNWLDPGTAMHSDWSSSTVNYWAERLYPLWADAESDFDSGAPPQNEEGTDILVLICNRTGVELGEHLYHSERGFGILFTLCTVNRHHFCRNICPHENETLRVS